MSDAVKIYVDAGYLYVRVYTRCDHKFAIENHIAPCRDCMEHDGFISKMIPAQELNAYLERYKGCNPGEINVTLGPV